MSDEKLIIELKKAKDLRVRQFKNHDRLYWTSSKDKLNIMATLRCKVKDIQDESLKMFILKNAQFLN